MEEDTGRLEEEPPMVCLQYIARFLDKAYVRGFRDGERAAEIKREQKKQERLVKKAEGEARMQKILAQMQKRQLP